MKMKTEEYDEDEVRRCVHVQDEKEKGNLQWRKNEEKKALRICPRRWLGKEMRVGLQLCYQQPNLRRRVKIQ